MSEPNVFQLSRWHQGPTDSGQGGWTAHRLVRAMNGPATVAIKAPIPLETDLHIVASDTAPDTSAGAPDRPWRLVADGGATILEATDWVPDVPDTAPVTIADAVAARGRFPLPGDDHPVPYCFSGGLESDSMRVHCGPVGDGRFATDWTVPDWAVGPSGTVDDGALWAAIDCAAAWYVCCEGEIRVGVTAQLAVEVVRPLQPGATYALVAWAGDWESGRWDGRKRGAASAAFDDQGNCVARSRSFWIALD